MERQRCNHCGEIKPINSFNWRWVKKEIRQRTCRSCQKQQQRRWYEQNKEIHKTNVYRKKKKRIEDARRFIWDFLRRNPCIDCGERDPYVLEFDHVSGRKKAEVTKMVQDGYALKTIQAEIEKCVIRCANCHKKKTYKDSWRDR